MKVYVVTAGSYSDYRIEGIFSTKEEAESYHSKLQWENGEANDVAEWEVGAKKDIRKVLCVSMHENGTTERVYKDTKPAGQFRRCFYAWVSGESVLEWDVETEDEDSAVKVVNEKRMQLIALGVWGDQQMLDDLLGRDNRLVS